MSKQIVPVCIDSPRQAQNAAWIWGWYSNVADAYTFINGAVGSQYNSYTANTIRSGGVPNVDGKDYWIDGTTDFFRLGEVPSSDRGAQVMVAGPEGGKFMKIPQSLPMLFHGHGSNLRIAIWGQKNVISALKFLQKNCFGKIQFQTLRMNWLTTRISLR